MGASSANHRGPGRSTSVRPSGAAAPSPTTSVRNRRRAGGAGRRGSRGHRDTRRGRGSCSRMRPGGHVPGGPIGDMNGVQPYNRRSPRARARMIFEQHYLGCLSQASYLIGDESTGRAVVVDPRRDVSPYLDVGGRARADDRAGRRDPLPRRLPVRAPRAGRRDRRRDRLRVGRRRRRVPVAQARRRRADRARRRRARGPPHARAHAGVDQRRRSSSTPTTTTPYGVLTGDTLFIGDVGRPDLLTSRGVSASSSPASCTSRCTTSC